MPRKDQNTADTRRAADRERLAGIVAAGGCDLHLHTTSSDGADTPEQMVSLNPQPLYEKRASTF